MSCNGDAPPPHEANVLNHQAAKRKVALSLSHPEVFFKTYFWIIDRQTWRKLRTFSEWGGWRMQRTSHSKRSDPRRLVMTCNPATGCCTRPTAVGGKKNCRMPQRMQPEKRLCIKSFARRTSEEHLDMCEHAPYFFFIAFREVER